MIIKVPVYVEVEKVEEGTDLKLETAHLSEHISNFLKGKKTVLFSESDSKWWKALFGEFKIISYGQALDSLRKRK